MDGFSCSLNVPGRGGQTHNTLYQSVYYYMKSIGEGHHEDCLRAFLRLRIRDLGGLLPHVAELVRRSTSNANSNLVEVIPQANIIVMVRRVSEAPICS